jgi:hypothetical protein
MGKDGKPMLLQYWWRPSRVKHGSARQWWGDESVTENGYILYFETLSV